MNKRIRKKRALQSQLVFVLAENSLMKEALRNQSRRIDELKVIVSRNAEVANVRFDQLEAENKTLRDEIDELKRKKSFWKRK